MFGWGTVFPWSSSKVLHIPRPVPGKSLLWQQAHRQLRAIPYIRKGYTHTHTLYIYDYICNYRCILYFIFVYIYLLYIYFIYIYILYIHVISIFITACTKTCIQYTDIRPCHFNTYVKTKEMTSIRVFVGGNCSNRLIFQGLWHYQLCWCSRRQGTSDPSVGERPWNWILGALPLW